MGEYSCVQQQLGSLLPQVNFKLRPWSLLQLILFPAPFLPQYYPKPPLSIFVGLLEQLTELLAFCVDNLKEHNRCSFVAASLGLTAADCEIHHHKSCIGLGHESKYFKQGPVLSRVLSPMQLNCVRVANECFLPWFGWCTNCICSCWVNPATMTHVSVTLG